MTMHFAKVFERDNRRCVYCGRDLMIDFDTFMITEEDHLIPLSKNGPDSDENIVTACSVCNRLKGNYMPDTEFSAEKKDQYIAKIREYIMDRKTIKMKDYYSWTHPMVKQNDS